MWDKVKKWSYDWSCSGGEGTRKVRDDQVVEGDQTKGRDDSVLGYHVVKLEKEQSWKLKESGNGRRCLGGRDGGFGTIGG